MKESQLSNDESEQFVKLCRAYTKLVSSLSQSTSAKIKEIRFCVTKKKHLLDQPSTAILLLLSAHYEQPNQSFEALNLDESTGS